MLGGYDGLFMPRGDEAEIYLHTIGVNLFKMSLRKQEGPWVSVIQLCRVEQEKSSELWHTIKRPMCRLQNINESRVVPGQSVENFLMSCH